MGTIHSFVNILNPSTNSVLRFVHIFVLSVKAVEVTIERTICVFQIVLVDSLLNCRMLYLRSTWKSTKLTFRTKFCLINWHIIFVSNTHLTMSSRTVSYLMSCWWLNNSAFKNIIIMGEHRCSLHYLQLVARHRSQMVTTSNMFWFVGT